MSQREHSLPLIWHRMHAGCYYSNTVTGVGSYRIERSFQGGGVRSPVGSVAHACEAVHQEATRTGERRPCLVVRGRQSHLRQAR